jgi:hypothetical protein
VLFLSYAKAAFRIGLLLLLLLLLLGRVPAKLTATKVATTMTETMTLIVIESLVIMVVGKRKGVCLVFTVEYNRLVLVGTLRRIKGRSVVRVKGSKSEAVGVCLLLVFFEARFEFC